MHCPKCKNSGFSPDKPCSKCKFSGDADLIKTLAHIDWMLNDLKIWGENELPTVALLHLKEAYEGRKKEIEISLGLRQQPFLDHETHDAWIRLRRYEILEQKLNEWLAAGDLKADVSYYLANQLQERVGILYERLDGHVRPEEPSGDEDQLKIWQYVLEVVNRLSLRNGFSNPQLEAEYRAYLQSEIETLEIKLGRRLPEAASQPSSRLTPEVTTAPPGHSPPSPETPARSPQPKIPLRERLWLSLLSERTLHAILFLGIFLLFTAAVSFVIWGWRDFSAPLRVAIPTGFTLLFFTLGWFVRTKTALYRSGVALSAIAALLIPIDLYTVYANFGSPPAYWAEFWLVASILCTIIYAAVTLSIQNGFFGYLVGVAAGSAILALAEIGYKNLHISKDWGSAGLSILALVLILTAARLSQNQRSNRWRVFIDPFRYLALLGVGVIMPLTLAWRYIDRDVFDTLHTATAINWWIGGLVLGWAAVRYRSRSLGLLGILSLPVAVYLTQAIIFDRAEINPAWHAFGLACLVPLYFYLGYRLSKVPNDAVMSGHSRSLIGCGSILLVVAALWSLTDLSSGSAAACSHAVLAGALVLAAILWRRPRYLYGASLFSFTAVTFGITDLGINLGQSGVGWATVSLIHLCIAISLGSRGTTRKFLSPLVISGYFIAFLALLAPLYPYDGDVLIYTLGNWLVLSGWGASLANRGQPGFVPQRKRLKAIYHWGAALPIPIWLLILFTNQRPLDFGLPLAFSALSWGMFALSLQVGKANLVYRRPWNLSSLLVSIAAPILAFLIIPDSFIPGISLLASGLLYFADAAILNRSGQLATGGLVTAWGYYLVLTRLEISTDAINFLLAILVSIYILTALWHERQKSKPQIRQFLTPLYAITHPLTLITIFRVYLGPLDYLFNEPWTDTTRLWGAATQILLGFLYLLFAWGVFGGLWGHLGVWLLAFGGGFIVIAYSSGQGRSAMWVALGAIGFVLAERGVHWFYQTFEIDRRKKAALRLVWSLYRNPFLVAGWLISIVAIVLALFRNLVVLGGGRPQQIWAALGLLLITGLYAVSARLFRQIRFVWFSGALSFLPWTILTNLGWFTPFQLSESGFAVSWIILAWLLFLISLLVDRWEKTYGLPLKIIANILVPASLVWGLGDNLTSRYTFGLAIAFFGFGAWLDHRCRGDQEKPITLLARTKYFYPTLGLIPVWSLYWLGWVFPGIGSEHYGILLLVFGSLGMVVGQWLERLITREDLSRLYGLPAYLTGYVCLFIGTVLVSQMPALLAIVLLYDAVLMIVSAWLFRNSLWVYLAAALVPFSLWISLDQIGITVSRRGWWLIGLAAIYLSQAWLTRRAKLTKYSNAVLAVGLILILVGLPPSSQEEIGAFWGYSAAVFLYTITAFWLRKPLILTLASMLAIVPYAVGLRQLGVAAEFYGLALFPGALVTLSLGWLLDRQFGAWGDFPWTRPLNWPQAFIDRVLGWWALPLYGFGFGFACSSPFFAGGRSDLIALNFALMIPIFSWAIYRFRLQIWLVALTAALHLAWGFLLDWYGWWAYPAYAWQRFAPVLIVTTLAGLWAQGHLGEKAPLKSRWGWSHSLYLFVLVDILFSQVLSMGGKGAGAFVTLLNALVIGVLVSAWRWRWLAYFSTALGAVALAQWLQTLTGPLQGIPVAFAYLAMGYGIAGYGLSIIKSRLVENKPMQNVSDSIVGSPDSTTFAWFLIWESPLQISGLLLSFGVLLLTVILGFDLAGWTARALFGLPFREIIDLATIQMAVRVLSILGLLYLATSIVYRRLRVGYLAVGMLVSSWLLYVFYVQAWDNLVRLQWYAIPVGLYLLGVAYLEWANGNRILARWLDYAAIVLMLGTLFWQTLVYGWGFAIMMGLEGLVAIWWGSGRRLRRFFYAGIVGVILATIGQLLNALQHINQWVTFGIIGLLLVIVGLIVERQRERLKVWQDSLDDWD